MPDQGYYLSNTNTGLLVQCHPDCKTCEEEGNDDNMQCKSCNDNNIKYNTNCYIEADSSQKTFYKPHSTTDITSCYQEFHAYIILQIAILVIMKIIFFWMEIVYPHVLKAIILH